MRLTHQKPGDLRAAGQRRIRVRAAAGSLLFAAIPALGLGAQEPVVKPTTDPPISARDRLPAPAWMVASQLPDGRIQVRWASVPGATSYALIRSVPPTPAQAVGGNVTDSVFIDSDVQAGKTYYYLVSGLNGSTTGLRKGTSPVSATRGVGTMGDILPPANVRAVYDAPRAQVTITWQGRRGARAYVIEGTELRQAAEPNWKPVGRASDTTTTMSELPLGGRVQFRVISQDSLGRTSSPALSNEVFVPPGGLSAPAATVAVSMGALSLRVGATTAATSAVTGFTPSRWLSLDEPIATVDASGRVTGRSPGRAAVLAIGRGSDGAVRVTLVQVTVTP